MDPGSRLRRALLLSRVTPVSACPDSISPQAGDWAPLRMATLRCALALLLRASRTLAPLEQLLADLPALRTHLDKAANAGLEGMTLEAAVAVLDQRLAQQAVAADPLLRLRQALTLEPAGLDAFLLCGLAQEDPSVAPLIDALRGHDGRPTPAFFADEAAAAGVQALLAAGFLVDGTAGRWRVLGVPDAVWQALHGRTAPGWRCTPAAALLPWEELILPPELLLAAQRVVQRQPPATLCWALRGQPGSGRRALAGALARAAGQGLIEAMQPNADPLLLAALGTLHGAMPLVSAWPGPGERWTLPPLPGLCGPVAVRLPRHGGLDCPGRQPRWLELRLPDLEERRRHWARALGRDEIAPALADLRLPRGRIHGVAAAMDRDGDLAAGAADEVDAQGRFLLDGLAQRVPPPAAGEQLALDEGLQEDFELLLGRCRHREALRARLPAAFGSGGAGVRALFKGPSGTGKTLAARALAAALHRPLYRVDLAATVSKYIGETERNLERVFEAAESLDVVLLLDEGDALMAGRTGVGNATDRYANLETNYLLQRFERYDGILVVTTNAGERIDAAFARRMDATLAFALPDAATRLRLWEVHLPPDHAVTRTALEEAALACTLSGGQIRNAALQATLLSLDGGTALDGTLLRRALRREYRHGGQACPSLRLDG
jgi:hypothetical protein